jgi:Xaa-Pro dipeptidase
MDAAIEMVKPGVRTDQIGRLWPGAEEFGFDDEMETYCPASDGFSAARIEEEVAATAEGAQVITLYPAEELPVANPY